MPIPYSLTQERRLSFGNPTEKRKAIVNIRIRALAFAKIVTLLDKQDNEVAWHGLVMRTAPHKYEIEDILVYPQIASGASVDTNQILYQDWLNKDLDTETFNKVRVQDHSHVKWSTLPSDKDYRHQSQIVSQLKAGTFYIFMIWNKLLECHVRVFDADEKMMYTGEEVSVEVFTDKAKSLPPNRNTAKKVMSSQKRLLARFYKDASKLIVESA